MSTEQVTQIDFNQAARSEAVTFGLKGRKRPNINVDIPPRENNLTIKDIEVVSYADIAQPSQGSHAFDDNEDGPKVHVQFKIDDMDETKESYSLHGSTKEN